MDLLVPEVISLISKLGAMMVLIKAGFVSLCHSLEERMTCTGGIGHTLSSCLLGCDTQDEAEDEAEVCAVCDECKQHYCTECIATHTCGTYVVC